MGIVEEIVKREFAMFQDVRNVGERAYCQDDWPTFSIMRSSQFEAWDEASRESYLQDLKDAQEDGRNLLMEKYAHMMAWTVPEQYAEICDQLPLPGEETKKLAAEICEVMLVQTEAYAAQYPNLSGNGRRIHAAAAVRGETAIEVYQMGELYTYSVETLRRLKAWVDELDRRGDNLPLRIMKYTSEKYGYASLEEAEISMKKAAPPTRLRVKKPDTSGGKA